MTKVRYNFGQKSHAYTPAGKDIIHLHIYLFAQGIEQYQLVHNFQNDKP